MTTVEEVLKFVGSHASREDLTQIYDAMKKRYNTIAFEASRAFRIGDKVEFTSQRTGERIVGTVRTINTKSLSLDVPGTAGWRVNPSCCKKV
jgi:hypothetical protein